MPFFVLMLACVLLPAVWLARRLRLSSAETAGLCLLVFSLAAITSASILSLANALGNLWAYRVVTVLTVIMFVAALDRVARAAPRPIAVPARSLLAPSNPRWLLAAAVVVFCGWFLLDNATEVGQGRIIRLSYKIFTAVLTCAGAFACSRRLLISTSGKAHTRLEQAAMRIAAFSLPVGGSLMLWLALNSFPAVEDALTMKLQKVVFMLQAGSILPSAATDDPRVFMSPPYPALVQMFFIAQDRTTHALLVFGFVNWVVCGLALHAMARALGATPASALVTTALMLFTPTLIIQGTSESDDLLAATPVLVSALFALRWVKSDAPIDAVLAGLGIGLAIGMKFTPLLFAPAVVFAIIVGARRHGFGAVGRWFRTHITGLSVAAISMFAALTPHFATTWVAYGNPLHVSEIVLATRNKPFSASCAARTITGYVKQLAFSDSVRVASALTLSPSAPIDSYRENVARTNAMLATIAPFDPGPECSAWNNTYEVTNWYISDSTFWFGIWGPVTVGAALAMAFCSKQDIAVRAIAAAPIVWMLLFGLTQKYIGEIGRYISMAVLLAGPPAALAIAKLNSRSPNTVASLWLVSGLTTAILAGSVLLLNVHRSLPLAAQSSSRIERIFSRDLRNALVNAKALNLFTMYGFNSYDYSLAAGVRTPITQRAEFVPHAINLVVAPRENTIENAGTTPFRAASMSRPIEEGFGFEGPVPQGNAYLHPAQSAGGGSFLLLRLVNIRRGGDVIEAAAQLFVNRGAASQLLYRVGSRKDGIVHWESDTAPLAAQLPFRLPASAEVLVIGIFGTRGELRATADLAISTPVPH